MSEETPIQSEDQVEVVETDAATETPQTQAPEASVSESTTNVTNPPSDPEQTNSPSAESTDDKSTDDKSAEKPAEAKPTRRQRRSRSLKDISLEVGQELAGKVKTITEFGAFVDVSLPQDGLLHISELARHRVEKVEDVLSVGDPVQVWVKNLDKERGRIGLTLIKPPRRRYADINVGDEFEGKVSRIENYGVFVDIGLEREGFIHISELAHDYVKSPADVVKEEDVVNVKVLKINARKRQVNLSIKALQEAPEPEVEEVPETPEVLAEEPDEPMMTAMAVAFNRNRRQDGDQKKKDASKKAGSMEDVVARTLEQQNA